MGKARASARDTFAGLHGRTFKDTQHLIWEIKVDHFLYFGFWTDCAAYYESLVKVARRQRWVRRKWLWGKGLRVVCPP